MEGYLPLVLLIGAAVILFSFFFYDRYKKRQYNHMAHVDDLSLYLSRNEQLAGESKETHDFFSGYSNPNSTRDAPAVSHDSDQNIKSSAQVDNKDPQSAPINDLLMISIMAKPDSRFGSYDLLQAISATGMQFGPMNIFHYYLPVGGNQVSLFSLASATEPGEFDLDHIGDFSCSGLILFMKLTEVPNPKQAFELMLQSAEQLAEDLDGELRADPRTPWSDSILKQYQRKISYIQAAVT